MPVGRWAIDVLVNNEMVGNEKLVNNWENKLYHYLYNIILLIHSCTAALDDLGPDIIICNDTFYYQWATLEALARERNIPCYNHWQGGRKMGWCYALGEPAMNLNMDRAWHTWRNRPLVNHERKAIDEFLEKRKSGFGMVINTADPYANALQPKDKLPCIEYSKPTAILATNAIWDLAALNKELLFDSMISWIHHVLDFFAANPQYQLLIKAHPVEKNKNVPQTRQLVCEEVKKHMPVLPANIILIEPDAPISVYEIIPHVHVGLVHTSTVGLELSVNGKPVVTCTKCFYRNKGFTYDPETIREYFDIVKNLLDQPEDQEKIEKRIATAKRFFYLYYFRYYTSLNIFDHAIFESCTLYIEDAKELLPGANPVLDYISASILEHLPIISEKRVPPKGGFSRNQYDFRLEEKINGGKNALFGYSRKPKELILNSTGELLHMQINDFRFYVCQNVFKKGELSALYNETCMPIEQNPHAYETEAIKIEEGDTVFDIGSCEGFFVQLALAKGAKKVIAIEPHPKLVKGIEKTYEKEISNGAVESFPVAFTNYNGNAFQDDGISNICEAKLSRQGNNKVKALTFDSFILAQNIASVDFVKMDVEGEEMNVILGMTGILKKYKPKLSIAVYHDYDNAKSVKNLILEARSDYRITFGGCYMFETPFRPYMVYAH